MVFSLEYKSNKTKWVSASSDNLNCILNQAKILQDNTHRNFVFLAILWPWIDQGHKDVSDLEFNSIYEMEYCVTDIFHKITSTAFSTLNIIHGK